MIVSHQTTHSQLNKQQLQLVRSRLASDGSLTDSLREVAQQLDCSSTEQLLQQVALTLGMRYVDLSNYEVDRGLLDSFPLKLIHRHQVFPLARTAGTLTLAISNPFDLQALDAISSMVGERVVAVVAQPDELNKLIKSQLGVGAETVDGLLAQQQEMGGVEMLEEVNFEHSEDAEMAQEASVVRLVNEILVEAVESRASDIHIEAQESGINIRYRIDGVLQRQPAPPEMNRFQAAIISRLKIMARMNIAEKRVPQDGRIKLRISGREIDVRVSVIPMLHGEGIVMRVLDKESLQFSLRGLGMSPHVHDKFQKLIHLPHGIILVTGPTGSGKTTTLYSALNEIKSEETKIITTEDPIEYQLDGINQIQVHTKVGLTFSSSLRGILRHDPDVVLVGEIRDLETAENAIQASLTGHLVFSTLHTNDAAGAFMRLCDMGVEQFLVSSTIEGVMAQRLVRRLCRGCRQSYLPTQEELPTDFPWERFGTEAGRIFRARGCRQCRHTGYQGRLGIYELLVADEEIRNLANERTPSNLLKQQAIRNGMQSLRSDGWDKVLQGVTTVDEVLRVSKMD